MQDLIEATAPADARPASRQYLTFTLGAEEYGIEILRVQEIRGYTSVTPIPNTPPHIKGVINLRGAVVPVVDLRIKFALADRTYSKFTVIVLVTIGAKLVGLVVDAVSDVLDVAEQAIDPAPDFGASVDTSCITGLARVGERLVILLDIEALVRADTLRG